jgi:dethiobiotin synthetase
VTAPSGPGGTPARPGRLVVIVGTGTEVGKTWLSERLLLAWRATGRSVAARKPAQSFEPGDDEAGLTDAQVLGRGSGEPADRVCPHHRWYAVAMAPPMAADALGRPPFSITDLLDELAWPDAPVDLGLVETAGGVRSPIAADGDGVALVAALRPDRVVLVADAGLGTINAVRLTLDALAPGAPAPVVFLNRYDPTLDLHRRNRDCLVADGVACEVDTDTLAGQLVGATVRGDA